MPLEVRNATSSKGETRTPSSSRTSTPTCASSPQVGDRFPSRKQRRLWSSAGRRANPRRPFQPAPASPPISSRQPAGPTSTRCSFLAARHRRGLSLTEAGSAPRAPRSAPPNSARSVDGGPSRRSRLFVGDGDHARRLAALSYTHQGRGGAALEFSRRVRLDQRIEKLPNSFRR